MRITLSLFLAAALLCSAGDKKKPITNEAGNDNVDITADPIIAPEELNAAIGGEFPRSVIAVRVKIVPKGDAALTVSRDDFILLSHKDGQRSGPYSPSQIAGSTTMVVRSEQIGGMNVGSRNNGPVWGGMPGSGGRPRQINDGSGTTVGSAPSVETKTTATIQEDKDKKENPLVKLLGEKMLPDKETTEPLTGLLYFPLDGKVKTKDLELIYQGPAGRLYIDFR